MNWYKDLIKLSAKRMFNNRTFLKKLEDYGVIVERVSKGGSNIMLLNMTNGKRSNYHISKRDVGQDVIRGVLRTLGIDYWSFYDKSNSFIPEEKIKEETEIPGYQKEKWWVEQQRYKEPFGV